MMRIWKIGFVALIIFLLLWVSHGLSQAMVSQWLKTYGDIYVESIEQTADGGLIAAGYIQPAGTEPRVACALKLDSNGELQWQKTYANANAPGSTATSIQQTRDGGYILGGGVFGSAETILDAWFVKLDLNGDIVWQTAFDRYRYDFPLSVVQTSDNGYVAAVTQLGQSPWFPNSWILKLNPNGGMVWKKKFNGAKSVFINKLYADSDSHLMASGLLFDRNSGKINEWFLMIDASGNIMWQKTINSDSGGHISDIDKTRDGGYVAAGYILRTGIKRRNALVIKTDNRGEILWQKAYGGFQSDTAAIIHQTSDRGFIVTGRTSSFGPRGGAIWVFKLNPSGVMSWQRTYNDFAPHLFPWSDQAADGGYYIGLKSDFPFYSPSDPELWLYKTDENGLIENCPLGDVTNARAESVNIVVQDAHVSTAEVELTPTRISPSTENADISRFEHCWTDWERPLEVVDWLDRVRMCPELPAEMGVVVPRRCVSGNENAFESYQLAKSLPTENIPDYLINIYSEISLGWFGMNFRVDPKETLSRLEALFAIAAAGNFYTQALKASITSRLKSTDRMDKQLLGSMVEGVNAMELDLMAPVNSKAAVSAGKHSAVDFNGIAWMIFNNVEESGSVFLKLKHGLPAFAKGMQPAWPIFTYELDFTGKIAKNGYLDLSFFIGGLNLVGRVSNARLLEWDGQSYRDITTHVDPLRSIIMGRTNRLATYVIMSPISKPIGPTSNQKAKLPYQN